MLRLSFAALCLAAAVPCAAEGPLTVVSWGGSYEAALREAVFDPFTKSTGIEIQTVRYDGFTDDFGERAERENWDVVDIQADHAITACEQGLLLKLDFREIVKTDPDMDVDEDFFDGAFGECGVAQNVYAAVVAFDDRAFPGVKPSRINDFFDLENFPGRRAIQKNPDAVLEWALLAVGVPDRQIYDLLSTARGLRLAFGKLSEIQDHIVWMSEISEATDVLESGQATMASGFNGRFFAAAHDEGAPISIVWDGRIMSFEHWAVSAGTSRPELSKEFIAFATEPQQLARLSELIPYGPSRWSALARVGRHRISGTPMKDHLPNAPHHIGRAIIRDNQWYSRTENLRRKHFDAWLAQQE